MDEMGARFWAKVDKSGDCWLWTGALRSYGYGSFWDGARNRRAHIVAWELEYGRPFPEGLYGCHSCDHPSCVKPDHIVPGTPRYNMRDAARKGRTRAAGPTPWGDTCPEGHAMTPENTQTRTRYGSVQVRCRECRRAYDAERWQRTHGVPTRARPSESTFACGHPRTVENTRMESGGTGEPRRARCRTCRRGNEAARAMAVGR